MGCVLQPSAILSSSNQHHAGPRPSRTINAASGKWNIWENTTFLVFDCLDSGDMSQEEAEVLVLENANECLGYCFHEVYPSYRWIVRKGSTRLAGQAGWTCMTFEHPVPTAAEVELFEDLFLRDPEALGCFQSNIREWKRPGRGEGLADKRPGGIDLIGSVDPNDLKQGSLGDSWLLCTMAVIAEYPQILHNIFQTGRISQTGKYTLQLYDYSLKSTVSIEIDDRLPLDRSGTPAFTDITSSGEIWPCLLEKAMAKMSGGYEQLQCGFPLFGLGVIMGCDDCLAFIERPIKSSKWFICKPSFGAKNPCSESNTFNICAWPDGMGGGDWKSSSEVLQLMARYLTKGFVLSCSRYFGEEQEANEQGLVHSNVFAILNVVLDAGKSGRNLLQIRNPWHALDWSGDWSDQSSLWTTFPQVAEEVQYHPLNDGALWMEDSDFFSHYCLINICCKTMPQSRVRSFLAQKPAIQHMMEDKKIPLWTKPPVPKPRPNLRSGVSEDRKSLQQRTSMVGHGETTSGTLRKMDSVGSLLSSPRFNGGPSSLVTHQKYQASIDTQVAFDLVQLTKATPVQLAFFNSWMERVFDEAAAYATQGGKQIVIATDLSCLEFSIMGEAQDMLQTADNFLTFMNVPDTAREMYEFAKQAYEAVMPPQLSLWCRLKNIGTEVPGVDCGVTLNSQLEWLVADLLMPIGDDQDALRAHAVQEQHKPSFYSCSLLPEEPERSLTFELANAAPQRLIMSSFFFFKSLGFVKPEDTVVRALSNCQVLKSWVTAAMGPRGLTKLMLRLWECSPTTAAELAPLLGCTYCSKELQQAQTSVMAEASFVDYVAGANGYSLAVGFVS